MKKTNTRQTDSVGFPPKMPESMASLASGIADDFNDILTTVMGACTLIDKDCPANSELLQYVALIRSSAEHAADLSDRLMRAGMTGNPDHPQNPDCALKSASVRDKESIDDIVSADTHPDGVQS